MSNKRFFLTLIFFSIMLVMVGCTVKNGNAWDNEESNFTYEIETYTHYQGARITGYTGDVEWVEVPEMIDGLVISAIESNALKDTMITNLRLPNSLRTLSVNSLNTGALTHLTFYGDYAGKDEVVLSADRFYEAIDHPLCTLETDASEPEDYVGLTFGVGCPIHTVLDVSGVVEIGGEKYYSYTVVVDIAHYERPLLSNFSAYTFGFEGNDTLKSIKLNDRLGRVSDFEYVRMSALETVYVPDENPHLTVIDNIVYDKDLEMLMLYPENHPASTFHVKGSVNNIFAGHFNGAANLSGFSVSEDNEHFSERDGVLYNHDETELLAYPPHKTSSEYTIPNTVEIIGYFSFHDNAYLTHLHIPESALFGHLPQHYTTRIYDVFRNLTALESFEVEEGNDYYHSIDGVLFTSDRLLVYPLGKTDETYHVPSHVEMIDYYAFHNHTFLKHIHINEETETIGWGAFLDAISLETVTFEAGSKLDEISHQAFKGAVNLSTIELPDQLFSIGMHAFRYTTSLEGIIIPASVYYIGSHAFYGSSATIMTPRDEPTLGWHEHWNYDNLEVVWSYTEDE